jgi:hypothetical protein
VTVKPFEDLRTMPVPDLWQQICGRLDERAGEQARSAGAPDAAAPARANRADANAPSPQARGAGVPANPAWRWAAPLAAAAAVLAVAGSLAVVGQLHGRPKAAPAAAFPGGGRILVADRYGLKWLYPNGRTTAVARGFTGARLAAGGTKLLAWRPTQNPRAAAPCAGCFADVDYYLMNLDGTGRRLVLPAESATRRFQAGHLSVQVSPAGTRLAYVRQAESRSTGRTLFDQLWTVNLITGQRTDLGPAPSSDTAVAWMNDHTLLAESPGSTTLRLVNLATGRSRTYLTIADPRIIRAYHRARPGAGPPTAIDPIGWSTDPRRTDLAVLIWGVSRRFPTKAAVALIGPSRTLSFAPDRNPLISLTWGPAGGFVLDTSLGDNPCCSGTYTGTIHAAQVTRQHTPLPGQWEAAALSPDGNVIALDYGTGASIWFIPVAPPGCGQTAECPRLRPGKPLSRVGSLQAWAP